MRIYVSGLYSGPNPSPGLGTARSLRTSYPDAELIGVDYSNRSTGIHWSDFDDIWLQRPWDELDLEEYPEQIKSVLIPETLWISGLDLEAYWLASALEHHPQILVPPLEALRRVAKPAIEVHERLPLSFPPYIETTNSDWDLHEFCRKYRWRMWLKGPYYEAKRIGSWFDFHHARTELSLTWSTNELFLQPHISGHEESIALCAFQGELLDSIYMSKRDVTPEGKTWAGQCSNTPVELVTPIRKIISELCWTGGAELELIRDVGGALHLLEWNPRFPAWIHGATLAGRNLPTILVDHVTGLHTKPSPSSTSQFVRVVLEIPTDPRFPFPPLAEPNPSSFSLSLKHPSGMPLLAERLQAAKSDLVAPKSVDPSAPPIPVSVLEDLASLDLHTMPTPCRIFLEKTALNSFEQTADLMHRCQVINGRVNIAYSIKTNPDFRLLNLAHRHGLSAEVISQLELDRAQAVGFPPSRIILNGAGKWWPNGQLGVQAIGAIFCDSLEELKWILAEGNRSAATTIGVRLRPPQTFSRFGMPINDFQNFRSLVSVVKTIPTENSFGIHFHMASSSMGLQAWWELLDSMLRWAKSIEVLTGRSIEVLDLGGGWFPDDWHDTLQPRIEHLFDLARRALPHVKEMILEPGKALAQPAMALAVRVLEVRRSELKVNEVIVDGSIAELPEASAYPHRLLTIDPEGKWHSAKHGNAVVLGRLCMESDVLAANVDLPQSLEPGDIIVVLDAGAYDRSMSYDFGKG